MEIEDTISILARLTNTISRPFGAPVGVRLSGSIVTFIDEDGDEITDDGEDIIAATRDEIAQGTHLKEFASRALYASIVASYQKLERIRMMLPKPPGKRHDPAIP